MFDFAIIGAGPAGSMAALQLAKQGYKTIVFEEHNSIWHTSKMRWPR
ncbi:MAG: FAD-dependent oxidoreductase [Thermoplasmata archaeon]|nr:MAG: FAD-dependent oxidoreductase [Thermoplasmata archaeon]